MKVLIVRHAIAVPAGTPDIDDRDRPLTPRGRKRFRPKIPGIFTKNLQEPPFGPGISNIARIGSGMERGRPVPAST